MLDLAPACRQVAGAALPVLLPSPDASLGLGAAAGQPLFTLEYTAGDGPTDLGVVLHGLRPASPSNTVLPDFGMNGIPAPLPFP